MSTTKPVTLKNQRTGEVWICDDYKARRMVDGNVFVAVHKPDNQRLVWMNLNTLVQQNQHR